MDESGVYKRRKLYMEMGNSGRNGKSLYWHTSVVVLIYKLIKVKEVKELLYNIDSRECHLG